jgi:subfamily B ATP-binding cassette protein MsbA
MLKNYLNFFSIFYSFTGKRLYLVLILSSLAAFFEGFGIFLIFPLFEKFGYVKNNEYLLNFNGYNWQLNLYFIGFLALTFFFLKAFFYFFSLRVIAVEKSLIVKSIKNKIFNIVSALDYQAYIKKPCGYYVDLINEQGSKSLNAFNAFAQFSSSSVSAFIYLIFASLISFKFAVIAIVAGSFVGVSLAIISKKLRQISNVTAQKSSKLATFVVQFLECYQYMLSTGQKKHSIEKIKKTIEEISTQQSQGGSLLAFSQSIREPIVVLLILIIVYYCVIIHEQKIVSLMASLFLFYRALNAILSMQINWQKTMENIGSIEQIKIAETYLESQTENRSKNNLKAINYDIEFCNVKFKYDKTTLNTLKIDKLKIAANDSVAFVGGSGAGKTTLIGLITLILRPNSGVLKIGSIDSRAVDVDSWRSNIGYVTQDNAIFEGTFIANITMNEYSDNPKASTEIEERVMTAAKKSCLHNFIKNLPEGYYSKIGEKGITLSGGEKQRLFIARELFRNPKILILDEATSSLDSRTESQLQKNIDMLRGKITLIIIAHRLSTVRNVDRIFVLQKGSIIEEGDFFTLSNKQGGLFNQFLNYQKI